MIEGNYYQCKQQESYYTFKDGSSLYCISLYYKKLNITALYLKKDTNIASLKGRALQSVSRLFSEKGSVGFFENSEMMLYEALKVGHKRKLTNEENTRIINWFNKVTETGHEQTDFKHEHVSLGHIRYATWGEVKTLGSSFFIKHAWPVIKLLYANKCTDWNEAFSLGLLIWYSILPTQYKQLVENSAIVEMETIPIEAWHRKVKIISMSLKALQNTVKIDLTPLFEIEVLVNRGVGKVDWQAEIDNRIKPNLVNLTRKQVYAEAFKLFSKSKMLKLKPQICEFKDFWETRWEWSTSGAYHSQYEEDNLPQGTHRLLRNKLYALNSMGTKSLTDFIHREPSIYAWSSIKYEWGKQRAIYGCDVTSYIVSSFAMKGCENVLDHRFPIGERSNEKLVHKSVETILRDRTSCCIDFEDFNSQHSNTSMQAVLQAYLHIFEDELSEEQRMAIVWVIESIENTYIKVPGQDFTKIAGTLMTGWRLTTFMNTVLNYIYKQIAQPYEMSALHNGDDIIIGLNNVVEVQALFRGFSSINARLQASKCYTGSIAEFLRVDHRTGTGGQYLARAVATYVHGKTESVVPSQFSEVAEACVTRKQEIEKRGAVVNIFRTIHEAVIKYIEVRWNVTYGMINKMESTHRCMGGLNNERLADIDKRFEEQDFVVEDKLDLDKINQDQLLPGVIDMFNVTLKRLELKEAPYALMKSFSRVIYHGLSSVRSRIVEIQPLDVSTAAGIRNVYKRFSDTASASKVKLCRQYNIPLVNKKLTGSKLAVHLAQYSNPMKWLHIVA